MKITLIITGIILFIFFISQAFVYNSTREIESYPYEVIKKYDDFEIRKYLKSNFSYVTMPVSSYKESSGTGFRTLAGYIFGDNSKNEKIAMTSPVSMDLGDSITMSFMIPAEYDVNELPKPGDPRIRFKTEEEKTVAAISFGGWANDERIKQYTEELKELLSVQNIQHNGQFTFLGYNPPFEVVNRRNEIIVQVNLE